MRYKRVTGVEILAEVLAGKLGIDGDGFAPHLFRFVFLAHCLESVAQVEHGIGEIRLLIDGQLIAFGGGFVVTRRLQEEAEIIGQLDGALAQRGEFLVKFESLLVILALDCDGG